MKYKLNIEMAFTDKITDEKYKVGDVKEFDEARAKELLADKRHLVSLNEIIEEKTEISEGSKDNAKEEIEISESSKDNAKEETEIIEGSKDNVGDNNAKKGKK